MGSSSVQSVQLAIRLALGARRVEGGLEEGRQAVGVKHRIGPCIESRGGGRPRVRSPGTAEKKWGGGPTQLREYTGNAVPGNPSGALRRPFAGDAGEGHHPATAADEDPERTTLAILDAIRTVPGASVIATGSNADPASSAEYPSAS